MILVTGAAGFLGRYVVEQLKRTYPKKTIIAAYHKRKPSAKLKRAVGKGVRYIALDLTKARALKKIPAGITTVIHLASYVPHRPEEFCSDKNYHVNVRGTWNLFSEMAQRKSVKAFIHASSLSVYGDYSGCFQEQSPRRPTNDYGLSKLLSEEVARKVCNQYRKKLCVLRFSSVYGWGQDRKSVLPRFIDACLAGKDMTLFDGGKRYQDFLYVKDAAEIVVRSMKKKVSGTLNAGSGKKVSMLSLARNVGSVFGERKHRVKLLRKSDPRSSMVLSVKRSREALRFSPRALKQGLLDYKKEMVKV